MQQGGGPPYPFSPTSSAAAGGGEFRAQMLGAENLGHQLAEAAPPISARPPADPNFEELGAAEEGERGGATGNRWPRQETLALLQIRSDMDAAFKDATLKGPLWEEVSRRLAELGYSRGAKKCKEKFENVHKYYKRTKEGRVGRHDGKSYRFFSQLEALHTTTTATSAATAAIVPTSISSMITAATSSSPAAATIVPTTIATYTAASNPSTTAVIQPPPTSAAAPQPATAAGISFSSNTSSSSSASDSDDDDDEATEEGPSRETGRKRKRGGRSGGGTRKMMAFFEGLMRQVIERQEAMHRRFLESIEKRENDRMIREEAWRRQEMARLAREQDIVAQERAAAASKDAAVISFLEKVTGQTITLPSAPSLQKQKQQPPPQPPPHLSQPQQLQQQQSFEITIQHHHHPPPFSSSLELVPVVLEPQHEPAATVPASSRWPKSEVLALIKLRSELDSRYQESGPKGLLWEEISAGMQRHGYNRSAKRCKEKWENINKYFKKVKESNKKRPEDAKTCPYFHQLEALYRSKLFGNTSGGSTHRPQQEPENIGTPNPNQASALAIMPPPPPSPKSHHQAEIEIKTGNGGNAEGGGGTSTGGISTVITKKPEGIVKELIGPSNNDNYDNDDDDDDDDEVDDEEDRKTQYRIQFQRQNVGGGSGGGAPNGGGKASAAGSFLALVR